MLRRAALVIVALLLTCAPALATATVIDWGIVYGINGNTIKTTHVNAAGTACANGQKAVMFLNVGDGGQTGYTIQNADGTASSWTSVYFDSVAAGSERFSMSYHDCGASEQSGGYKVNDNGAVGGTHSEILIFISGAPVGDPCVIGNATAASAATSITQTITGCGLNPLTLAPFGNDATGEVFSTTTTGWTSVTNNGAGNNPGITLLQAASGSLSVTATVTPSADSLFSRALQFGSPASSLAPWIGGFL